MKKLILAALFLLIGESASMGQDLDDLLNRAENLPRPPASEGLMKMVIENKAGQQRVRIVKSYGAEDSEGTDMQMLVFMKPADVRGTRFLTLTYEDSAKKDEQYIYIPALRKVRSIGTSGGDSKTGAFLGSDFTYADIIPLERADFNVTKLGDDSIDGQPYVIVEYAAKGPETIEIYGYSKVVRWIHAENATSRRSEYYDPSGNLVKRLDVTGQKLVEGYWQFKSMVMNNLETGGKTIWQVDEFEMLPSIDPKYFTMRYLQRGR